jgi:hypothetical protein
MLLLVCTKSVGSDNPSLKRDEASQRPHASGSDFGFQPRDAQLQFSRTLMMSNLCERGRWAARREAGSASIHAPLSVPYPPSRTRSRRPNSAFAARCSI